MFQQTSERMGGIIKRNEVETAEHWDQWCTRMPKLKFDPDWEIVIYPPVGGALVRFGIWRGPRAVSIYFDAFKRLGFCEPYWELYPDAAGDNARFLLGEEAQLLEAIRKALA